VAVMKIGERFYVYFKWQGQLIRTVTTARNEATAKRIDKAVRTAFRIYRFDHLNPDELDFVVRTFQNKGWKLPPELQAPAPEEELTIVKAIKAYLDADEKHRRERNIYAIDRLIEYFGDNCPLAEIKVPQIRRYRKSRLEKVQNATVNRELSALSGIFRVQAELDNVDFNPCRMIGRLPESQRDNYVSWEDFNRLLEHSWWLRDIITMMYYTGMRFGEVVNLCWEMFKPERRMLVLPPSATKEGKSAKRLRLQPKRVPLRREVMELLESIRRGDGDNVIRATGLVFRYSGRYRNHCGTYQGKPVDRFMIRKAWSQAVELTGLEGLQIRDIRHSWKTNAQRSGMDYTIRNLIVGHSSQRSVEDRYIRASDEQLLKAVDEMTFDHGWTELDFVEEGLGEGDEEKVRKEYAKSEWERKKSLSIQNDPLTEEAIEV